MPTKARPSYGLHGTAYTAMRAYQSHMFFVSNQLFIATYVCCENIANHDTQTKTCTLDFLRCCFVQTDDEYRTKIAGSNLVL